jgi:hypothetical protein
VTLDPERGADLAMAYVVKAAAFELSGYKQVAVDTYVRQRLFVDRATALAATLASWIPQPSSLGRRRRSSPTRCWRAA